LIGLATEEATFNMFLSGEMPRNAGDWGYFMRTNHMTRVICGAHLDPVDPGSQTQWTAENEHSGTYHLEMLDRRHLECAKSNLLRDFALIIVIEDMHGPVRFSSALLIPAVLQLCAALRGEATTS
jgi:hypothetical protein